MSSFRLALGLLLIAMLFALAAGAVAWRYASHLDERDQVRRHLGATEAVLRARDVTALSPAQRTARARNIERLAAYRRRGVFPHNHHARGRRVPVFVDDHGTLCAMAHLIEQSGATDVVRLVAATCNGAYVRELADLPQLVAWLDHEGLTLAEAARIQPSYGYLREDVSHVGTKRVVAYSSMATGATLLVANVVDVNRDHPNRWTGLAGLLAGTFQIGACAMLAAEDEARAEERIVAGGGGVVLGIASAIVGVTALTRRQPRTPPQSTTPMTWVIDPSVSAESAALALRVQF